MPASNPPVIPYFLRQAVRSGTLVVHGDGQQTRDYVYVDDVVNAMTAAATAPDVDCLVINVGSGKETSVRELVRLVMECTGGAPEVVNNPRVEGGVSRSCADITLAAQKLGYAPHTSLEDGLRRMVEREARAR